MKTILPFLCVVLLATILSAQAESSLPMRVSPDQLVAQARQNNPEIAAAKAREEAAQARQSAAGTLDDPTLMVGHFVRQMNDRRMYSLSQALPFPGTFSRQRDIAGSGFHQTESITNEISRLIESRLRLLYADLALLEARIKLREDHLLLIERTGQLIEARLGAGQAISPDLLRNDLSRGRIEDSLESMRSRRPALQAAMNALLGHDPAHPLPPLLPLDQLSPEETHLEIGRQADLSTTPALQTLGFALDASRSTTALVRREGLPKFQLSVEYMETTADLPDTVMVGVGLRLPIWRERYRSRERQSRAESRALQADLEDLGRRLQVEYTAAWDARVNAAQRITRYRDQLIPRAQQMVAAEEARYQRGESDLLRVIDARRELLDLAEVHHEALADALRADAALRRLIP